MIQKRMIIMNMKVVSSKHWSMRMGKSRSIRLSLLKTKKLRKATREMR
jgi:hypothetical protein